MSGIKSPNFEKDKNLDKIGPHNSIDENLRILKERLTEVKPGFDFKVTPKKSFKLLYNCHELNLEIKNGENLVATAKMIKDILDKYKIEGFDKKKYRFYKEVDPVSDSDTLLKIDNNLLLLDYVIGDGGEISKTLGSNLISRSEQDYKSIRKKKDINTGKVADFLNSILDDYFKS